MKLCSILPKSEVQRALNLVLVNSGNKNYSLYLVCNLKIVDQLNDDLKKPVPTIRNPNARINTVSILTSVFSFLYKILDSIVATESNYLYHLLNAFKLHRWYLPVQACCSNVWKTRGKLLCWQCGNDMRIVMLSRKAKIIL